MSYRFRKARPEDVLLYFEYRNEEGVRANSISKEPISLENHKNWFLTNLDNPNRIFYVLENDESPIGQLRFDIEDNSATINYSIDRKFRGQGLGNYIIEQGIEELKKEMGNLRIIIAKVIPSNIPSCKIFEKLGFKIVDEESVKGVRLFCFQKKLSV